ncbi:MAG TPA: 5'-3' exonuclease [Pseudogracilibacillus sp.]|nr:5'-3' exonuclease [Pseudogracilibacillus sp.]
MKKHVLLVDGMALLFRGFFSTSFTGNFMKNDQGIPTNGVQQFLKYFIDGINTFKPTHVICCWDMGSKTFRTDMFPNYKANREDPPEELIPQFDMVKDVVSCFNIPNIGIENYEADDIIGTLANTLSQDHQVTIQSGDLDLLQLVKENVQVAIMRKGIGNYEVFDIHNFYDKKQLHPHQIIDFKGLTGDNADNYPGIKGIGEKTAIKLLAKYESVDQILEALDELTPGQRNKFEVFIDDFHMSKQLATIKSDLEVELDLKAAEVKFNPKQTNERIQALGVNFNSVEKYYIV